MNMKAADGQKNITFQIDPPKNGVLTAEIVNS